MLNNMFAVYDEKARAYLPPFFFNQVGQAQRVFTDCINSKDHQFGNHPSDYTLFHLGSYNDENASFETFTPKSLGNGVEFIDLTATEGLTAGNSHAKQIRDETQLPEHPEG